MWRLNGAAANYLVATMAFLLAFSLLFSFRDTLRALAEFFDIRAIRRVVRQPLGAALLLGLLLALVFLGLWMGDAEYFFLLLIFAGLFLVPGLSLAWLLVTDTVEALGPRKRCKRLQGMTPLQLQRTTANTAGPSTQPASSQFNQQTRRSNR